jgi:hypothetical protein
MPAPAPQPPKRNLRAITALVVDHGYFVGLAVKLAESYGKVYYTVPTNEAFPKMNTAKIGEGLPGIEVVDDVFGDHFDECDLIIFPDVGFGKLQMQLVSMGKKVWGSRLGEKLELDRVWAKKKMQALGLPVGPYTVVTGMDALRQHLKTHQDVHVKISKFRGQMETFGSKDYKYIEPKLDEIEHELGQFKHDTEFVVEEDLPDRFEIGSDGYSIDGVFPEKTLAGLEIKNESFVGAFLPRTQLPPSINLFEQKIAPILKEFGYRGFISDELRIGKDTKGYMIDACCRAASPPSELYSEFYLNLAEIIAAGADGVCLTPKPAGRFGAEAIITSHFAETNFVTIDIPKDILPFVKLRNCRFANGRYQVIPQDGKIAEIGAVIGWGDSLEAAIEMVKDIAKQVDGVYLDIKTESFDRAPEMIEKGEEYGVKLFS